MAVKKSKTAKKTKTKKVDKKETIVMNGDPTVITPVEEIKIEEDVLEAVEETEDLKDIVDQDPPIEKEYLDAIVENKATMELELDVMNGDPTVVSPIDEIQEKAFADTFKDSKINKRIDNFIGYSWNGMEMDNY